MGSYLYWIILARGGSAESCAYRPYRLGEVEERKKREHVRKARERTLQAAKVDGNASTGKPPPPPPSPR